MLVPFYSTCSKSDRKLALSAPLLIVSIVNVKISAWLFLFVIYRLPMREDYDSVFTFTCSVKWCSISVTRYWKYHWLPVQPYYHLKCHFSQGQGQVIVDPWSCQKDKEKHNYIPEQYQYLLHHPTTFCTRHNTNIYTNPWHARFF